VWHFENSRETHTIKNQFISLTRMKLINIYSALLLLTAFSCSDPYLFKNDYDDNTPTSGKLKVYYDESLQIVAETQEFTFEGHYKNANVELVPASENDAVQALYNDSCKVIMISRQLTEQEIKAFIGINVIPRFSAVAKSGVALITNSATPVGFLDKAQIIELLTKPFVCKDSVSNESKISVLFDKNNSSVMHYLKDSVVKGQAFSSNCTVLGSTEEAINYVAKNKNTIAFIDFAWLSDVDDSLRKANQDKIKFIALGKGNGSNEYEYPNQDSFKREAYLLGRTIYVYRRSSEFSLGKGFETFVAGPVGQTAFLKLGLLPTHQQGREIQIKMEPIKVQ
jgi:phosphate transport system substrate-binding protein